MVAIRYNKRSSFTFPTSQGELVLYPGVNLNVPDKLWAEIKRHPIAKTLLQLGELEPLTQEPSPTGEIEGIPIIDRPDEPVPAMPVQDRSAAKVKKPPKGKAEA